MIKIALAVPWCPWIQERVESMKRLRAALDVDPVRECGPCYNYREFTDRAPNDQWSEQVWTWLSETDAEWCLQIQEDALVAPDFLAALDAFLVALPPDADVVGLQVPHLAAPALAEEGLRRFTTADMLIGVGYVIRRTALVEFLSWRAELKDGWRTAGPKGTPAITEDTMLGVWAMSTERPIWHPIPTLLDHDISIPSTYGHNASTGRSSVVRWDHAKKYAKPGFLAAWTPRALEDPDFWRGDAGRVDPVRHLGRFYDVTPRLAREWIPGFDGPKYRAAVADNGERQLRRLAYAQRARADWRPKAKILVATPTLGRTSPEYVAGMLSVVRLFECDVAHGFDLLDSWQWNQDLVRVRSRFVRAFLEETDATHLFFVDSDVGVSGRALLGMLQSGHDVVMAPYPKRDAIPYQYAVGHMPGTDGRLDTHGCLEIAWGPLGCCLISRTAAQSMTDRFREIYDAANGDRGLSFIDSVRGVEHETVALFQLMSSPGPRGPLLRSEDQSFCFRAAQSGYQPRLYLGPGSPVNHSGEHLYRGAIEHFGLHRIEE